MTDSLTIELLEAVQAWGLGGGGDDDHDELLHAFTVWFDAGGSVSQVEQLLTIGQAVMDAGAIGPFVLVGPERFEYAVPLVAALRAVGAVTDTPPDAARRGSVQEGKT